MIGRDRATTFRRVIRIALGVYWCILLAATHLPPRNMPHVEVNDKFDHLAAYSVLALLIGLSWRWSKRPIRAIGLQTIIVVMIAGATDELTQPIFGRDCELLDWCADVSGAIVGAATAIGVRSISKAGI